MLVLINKHTSNKNQLNNIKKKFIYVNQYDFRYLSKYKYLL